MKKLLGFSTTKLAVILIAMLILTFISPLAIAANNLPSEVAEQRTQNSKTYYLGENSYSWDGTIGAIHYQDNGWQEIDNFFEVAQAPWDWQMLNAGYHIKVKEDFTAGQIIEFEKQGETIQLQPMALEWTNDLDQIQPIAMPHSITPVITNPEVDLLPSVGMPSHQGTIKWNNAYGEGINFEWKCTSTRLVKILEIENINKLSTPQQYIIDGGNPVLKLNLIFAPSMDVDIYIDGMLWNKNSKIQTFGTIEFSKYGEVLWGFMPLLYWDSIGNYKQSVATLEKSSNKLYISIRIPYEWLLSAVYPIFIDTDVDEQVGASGDDGYAYSTTFMGDYSQLRMGSSNSSSIRAFARFTDVIIPADAIIGVNCYASFFVWNTTQPGVYLKVKADDLANPDAPADATEVFAITPTTTGVDWDDQVDVDDWANTPDIQSVIAELQASYDYSAGASITIIVDDDESGNSEILYSWSWDYDGVAPKLHIEYTVSATDITNIPDSKDYGVVSENSTYETGLTYFTVTNNSSGAVTITIKATDFTGGNGWTLSDTATPDANTAGLKAGLEGGDYTIIVKKTGTFNTLVSGLAAEGTQKWGLKLYTPTTFSDGVQKSTTVTLTAVLD